MHESLGTKFVNVNFVYLKCQFFLGLLLVYLFFNGIWRESKNNISELTILKFTELNNL